MIDKVKDIINYTKSTKSSYTGRSHDTGYHSFVLNGIATDGARDNAGRIAKMGYDFAGKNVLDIGCNMGGILHQLSSTINYGVGIDFDPKLINVANLVKDYNGVTNINFYRFDLDKEDLNLINSLFLRDRIDICMFLAVAMHINNWRGVIDFCHAHSDTLLFEANGRHRVEMMQYVDKLYSSSFLYSDGNRDLYMCRKR